MWLASVAAEPRSTVSTASEPWESPATMLMAPADAEDTPLAMSTLPPFAGVASLVLPATSDTAPPGTSVALPASMMKAPPATSTTTQCDYDGH
jgi:hypothetical protein